METKELLLQEDLLHIVGGGITIEIVDIATHGGIEIEIVDIGAKEDLKSLVK